MPRLILRGAYIRYADIRMEKEGGVFVRMHCSATFSEPVRKAMNWGPLQEGSHRADLDGLLTATTLIMTPNSKELNQHEIQIDVKEIGDFKVVRLLDEDGESTQTELRFVVRSGQEAVGAAIENYMRLIGRGEAQFRVAYEAQGKLPLDGESDEDADDGEDEGIEEHLAGPALASHREMAGGTTDDARRAKRAVRA